MEIEDILRRDKLFVKIKEATGIKITAKDLRDVFASTITMGNEDNRPDVKTVSELLGYTNIATTQKYLFSFKQKKMKAMSVIDNVYGVSISPEISPENKKDLEKSLSPFIVGGGAWNRTRDTTDMRLSESLTSILNKSHLNNLINNLSRRNEMSLFDLLRLLFSILPQQRHGDDKSE